MQFWNDLEWFSTTSRHITTKVNCPFVMVLNFDMQLAALAHMAAFFVGLQSPDSDTHTNDDPILSRIVPGYSMFFYHYPIIKLCIMSTPD